MRAETPLDGIDSRVVLHAYALVVAPVGLVIAAWGSLWINGPLNGPSFGIASLVRMTGVVIAGAGLTAAGLARISSPDDRRTALRWFLAGHVIVLVMAAIQRTAIWPDGPTDWILRGLALASLLLFYALARADGDPTFQAFTLLPHTAATEPRLRSRYEEEIRKAAAQEERNRLARDLHDSVKQQLFVVQTSAATAEARLGYDAAGAAEALAHVRDGAREAMAEMDAMTDQLRAAPLENNGLLEALKRQCEALGLRSGATVTFDRGRLPANEAMPPGSAEALFRVAQEALANVARHARANHVRVSLGTDHGLVILEVHDDGKGFDRNQIQTGSGLSNMRARAAEFNAEVTVESPPGGGTTVRFALPYAVADAADFRRKAFWTGSALILVAVLSIANPRGGSSLAILMIIPLFEFVRYTLAWRRARRLEAGTT